MKSHLIANKKSVSTMSSVVIFVLAILFGIIGYRTTLFSTDYTDKVALLKALFPIGSCVLMLLILLIIPKRGFIISTVAFLLAIIAAMLNAFELKSLIGYGEIAMCLALAVIYCCTVFGAIKHKIFGIVLLIIYLAYHIWMVVRIQILTSFYTFTQLSTEIAMFFTFVGFIVTLCGATRNNKIDPHTAVIVPPPVPGGNKLGGVQDTPVSEPEPISAEPEKPIETVKEEAPETDKMCVEATEPFEEKVQSETVIETASDISEEKKGTVSKLIGKLKDKGEKPSEPTRPLDDSAEEIGMFEERTDK